jgi:hypothetical protein
MFDAKEYFVQVERLLGSCRASTVGIEIVIDGPHYLPSLEHWEVITFKARIAWPSGEVLEVLDLWERRDRKWHLMHDFHYQFMQANTDLIFRLDTHGEKIPYDGKCHVHLGPEGPKERILEDDDSRLHGYRLTKIDFLNVFALVHKYLNHKQMLWD